MSNPNLSIFVCLTGQSGIDFDDYDYGFKEEDKDSLKVRRSFFFYFLTAAEG